MIDETLRRARHALRTHEALLAAGLATAAVSAVLLAAFALAVAGVPVTAARPWFLGAAAIVALAALARAAWPFLKPHDDDAIAKRLGDADPKVGDGLLSAVQLHRDADTLATRFALSRELIDLHVDTTAEGAGRVDPALLVDRRLTNRLLAGAFSALGLWLLLSLAFPGVAARSRAFLFGSPPGTNLPGLANAVLDGAAPRLGDVTVTYRYPEYTGRAPETLEGTDGNLKALKGTIARISLKSDRPVKNAQIVLNGKDSLPLTVTATPAGSAALEGEVPILENGTWLVEAKSESGKSVADATPRTITVDEDAVPTVQIVWPAQADLEVNELEDVDVTWGAEDDFGLKNVELVWENHPPDAEDGAPKKKPGKAMSGKIPLASFPRENPTRHGDRMRWALATLGLEPGGYVEYWVEATDNDTVSGPKKGRSQKYRLHLLSSSQIHERAIALQEEAMKRMVLYLADHLEIDPKQVAKEKASDEGERFEGKAKDVSQVLSMVATEMLDDPLGDEQVYRQILNIRSDLDSIATSYSPRTLQMVGRASGGGDAGLLHAFEFAHGQAIPVLEKDILFLDKLIEKQRFDGARQELAKLAQEQKDLKAMLEKYKKGELKDAEMAKALEAKLAELQRRMAEVAEKMASTLKSMPNDFDNSALQDDILTQIQKAIEEGRMDDAAALTEQMLNGLDEMLAQMDQMEKEFNLDPETAKRLGDAQKELAKLAEEQKKVTDNTNALREQIQQRQDASGQRVNDFAKKELEKVKKLREEIEQLERQSITDPWMRSQVRSGNAGMERDLNGLEGGLKNGELGEALQHAGEIESTLQGLKSFGEQMRQPGGEGADPRTIDQAGKAQAKAQEIVEDLEKLRKSFEDSATQDEKSRLSDLSKKQEQLRQRAQGLSQELGELSEETPFIPGEAAESVNGAAQSMGEASGKLRQGNAAGAVPSERQAQAQLGEAQAQMEGAGGGKPQPGMGTPLAQRMGMRRDNRGQEGRNGFSNEKLEIPDGSQFRVPKEFREDILEAMKKPSPEGYKQLNQEYYERLIK